MASLNEVNLIGNLGKDPKITTLTSGSKVATFSIATSETWKDKNTNERRERTEWHNIVVYNENLVRLAETYLKKGSRCYLKGELRTRKYQDQGGADRYTTEIVLSAFRGAILLLDKSDRPPPAESDYGTTRSKPATSSAGAPASSGSYADNPPERDLDDDIPF